MFLNLFGLNCSTRHRQWEPNFSVADVLYTQICKHLNDILIIFIKGEFNEFRVTWLEIGYCQHRSGLHRKHNYWVKRKLYLSSRKIQE